MTWTTVGLLLMAWCLVSIVVALIWGRILFARSERYDADQVSSRPLLPVDVVPLAALAGEVLPDVRTSAAS